MPVRVEPWSHGSTPIDPTTRFSKSSLDILRAVNPTIGNDQVQVLQSSFKDESLPPSMKSSDNGLVSSIIKAYSNHHHLTLRPEDIWLAILTQTAAYITAHAEELRHKFVEHEGQKELKIEYRSGSRFDVDFSEFARDMTKLIEQNIIDPEFRTWVLPKFSTTTQHDEVVASIVMMASMKKYFIYHAMVCCGIPSVTLLGEKSDYEQILLKLNKLETLGTEPGLFAGVLRPVIKRLIGTFDNPRDPAIIDFWKSILDVSHGSGMTDYTGWVTAFCFWNDDGECLYPDQKRWSSGPATGQDRQDVVGNDTFLHRERPAFSYARKKLVLDGVPYHSVERNSIPPGWSKVPVKITDNGKVIEAEMVAGSVGISCSSSGIKGEEGAVTLDTMQPSTGWWIYEKTTAAT